MNSFDILNAIGDVDDEYVTKAKAKKTSYKKVWITLGSSLAACLALFIGVPVIFAMTMRASAPAPGANSPAEDHTDLAVETAPVYADVKIFYVDDGKICNTTLFMPLVPEDIFTAWRWANNIGDEVKFAKCQIEDNSTTVERETSFGSVMEHTVGDYFILNVTISKNIENYYNRVDSELLLDSLKQTMTGYSDIEFDEYHLILYPKPEFDEAVVKFDGGEIVHVVGREIYGSQSAFDSWRSTFGIGDEVKLIDCEIKHEADDYLIMNLTISKELENYYEVTDREKLLETLEETMTSYSNVEFAEYHLTLV